jgi:hypothetical protein
MRRMSVLIVMALFASTAFAGGVDVTDPPDIRLLEAAALPGAFNLGDYHGTSNAGAAAYAGDAEADGTVNVPGDSAPGMTDYAATITVGADSADVGWTRLVRSAALDNVPLPGEAPFVVALRAGAAADSAAPLSGGPAGDGGGSPGNGTPSTGAAWMITFASVDCGWAASGLKTRTSAVTAGPADDTLTAGGLTASIDADGNYSLLADESFAGPVVVTFIKAAGDDKDSASVVAAANAVAADAQGVAPLEIVSDGSASVLTILDPVAAAGKVRISAIVSSPDGATVGLGAMDSSVLLPGGGQNLALVQVSGSEVPTEPTLLVTYYTAPSGSLVPIINVDGVGTVTVSDLTVAPCETDLCYGVTMGKLGLLGVVTAAPVAGDMSGGLEGLWQNDFDTEDEWALVAAEANGANNFATAGAPGSISLPSADGNQLSNISVYAAGFSAPGLMSASVFAQNGGAAGVDTFAALVVSAIGADGLSFFTAFVSADNIPADGWAEIETVGAIQDGSSGILVTVQNAGTAGILVDDLCVFEEDSTLATFDANLLG